MTLTLLDLLVAGVWAGLAWCSVAVAIRLIAKRWPE